MHDDRQTGGSRLSWTLWLMGSAALATLIAAACGSADETQPGDPVTSTAQGLHDDLEAVSEVPAGYVQVPGGRLLHKDCVHAIPDGAEVDGHGNVSLGGVQIAHHAACTHKAYRHLRQGDKPGGPVPTTGNGWVEGIQTTTRPFQAMFTKMISGTFQVPAAPTTNNGQTVFFFPSFTSATWIVQPVLQWGPSSAGGGAYWTMANWIVSGPNAFFSTAYPVTAGDTVQGIFSLLFNNSTSQTWTVSWYDYQLNGGVSTNLTITDGNPMNAAQPALLEAYGITSCTDFPSTGFTQFSATTIYEGNDYNGRSLASPLFGALTYTSTGWTGPVCGFKVNLWTDGRTQMYY